jgi:hypothetical protein
MTEKYPQKLGNRLGNIFLGFATDGVNPWGNNGTSHSTWPIMLVNLNIPPWLAIKASHIILTAIIPGNTFLRAAIAIFYLQEPLWLVMSIFN